jgi:hypothetical protein
MTTVFGDCFKTDGDGFTAWQEYRDGTDPTDANRYFRLHMSELSGSLEGPCGYRSDRHP